MASRRKGAWPEYKAAKPGSTHLSTCSRLSPTLPRMVQVYSYQSLSWSRSAVIRASPKASPAPSSWFLLSPAVLQGIPTGLMISKPVQPGQIDPLSVHADHFLHKWVCLSTVASWKLHCFQLQACAPQPLSTSSSPVGILMRMSRTFCTE